MFVSCNCLWYQNKFSFIANIIYFNFLKMLTLMKVNEKLIKNGTHNKMFFIA